MGKGLIAAACLALTLATLAGFATAAPKSAVKPSQGHGQTPVAISGRWIAVSTSAMGITGDIELRDGQLRTRRGAIPLQLQSMRLANYDGEMWIAKIGPTARNALINGNQFCPHKGYPDQGRWLVVSRPSKAKRIPQFDDQIDIDVYETWEIPTQFGNDKPYYCGGMRYERAGGPPVKR